jgi:LmbE family N-acetylglucosaminyl deacetylase
MKNNILIIAAHPDDETLGCGGLIYQNSRKNNIKVIFLGEGTSCRFSEDDDEDKITKEIEKRKKYCIKALKTLGVKNYEFYNLPCGQFDQTPIIKIGKIIEKEIIKFKPQTIITHSKNDVHIDHQITHQATIQSTRPGINNFIEKILSFEILSSSEKNFEETFSPNYFVKIDAKTLRIKIKALKCYKSEISKHPFSRSELNLKSLALIRGAQSGNYYAEAFKVIRIIKKN